MIPRFQKLSPDFEILLEEKSTIQLSKDVQRKVDEIWERERKQRSSKLFNESLLAIRMINNECCVVSSIEYKQWLAQLREPGIFGKVPLVAISVSGFLRKDRKVVIGKRNRMVTLFPEMWELAPSGGVTLEARTEDGKIDFRKQLLIEMEEELGFGSESVLGMTPWSAFLNTVENVLDIAIECQLKSELSKFKESPEYTEIRMIDLADSSLVASIGPFIPSTTAAFKSRGILP